MSDNYSNAEPDDRAKPVLSFSFGDRELICSSEKRIYYMFIRKENL